MPVYDYECEECGVFTAFRSMSLSATPCDCPECDVSSRRVFLSAPNSALMDTSRRTAFATNERSADSPKNTRSGHGHGPGCSCCSGTKKPSRTLHRPDGSKTFPSARPWMISH